MKFPVYLDKTKVDQLEFEHVSDDLKVYLTRKLEKWAEDTDDSDTLLFRKNRLINMSRTISGDKIYVLEADDMGGYWTQERVYHDGRFLLIFRNLSTVEFIEFVCELITEEYLTIKEINELLEKDGVSFRFVGECAADVGVEITPIKDLEESEPETAHNNIRVLVHRMNSALDSDDYAGVLHASASIFETLAKDVVGLPTVQDKTLASFFDRYRKDSLLPEAVLDYILDTYLTRNVTPLAGHGSTATPTIKKEQTVVLVEMTKAFVRTEYKLRQT